MKIILALVLIGFLFMPGSAFAWKSLAFHNTDDCTYDCTLPYAGVDHSSPMNFLMLGVTAIIGLGVYYKYAHTEKYATISLKCESCGRRTNGLKCAICEERKQRIK